MSKVKKKGPVLTIDEMLQMLKRIGKRNEAALKRLTYADRVLTTKIAKERKQL